MDDLQKKLLQYKRFFDECPIGLYKTRSEDGLFLDINEAGAKMLGYDSPDEVIHKVYSTELYGTDVRRQLILHLKKYKRVTNFEAEICRKDETCIWASVSATNGGDKIIGSIEDITERKQLEQEIEELKSLMVEPLKELEQHARKRIESYDKKGGDTISDIKLAAQLARPIKIG